MSRYILYILICIFCAGAAKGVGDTLQFHYTKSVFSQNSYNQEYWNPALSWKNKYKDIDKGDKREKFPGSTTIFVNTTDAWHLFQSIEAFSWIVSLFCVYLLIRRTQISTLLDTYQIGELGIFSIVFTGAYVCYAGGFTLFYKILLVL